MSFPETGSSNVFTSPFLRESTINCKSTLGCVDWSVVMLKTAMTLFGLKQKLTDELSLQSLEKCPAVLSFNFVLVIQNQREKRSGCLHN